MGEMRAKNAHYGAGVLIMVFALATACGQPGQATEEPTENLIVVIGDGYSEEHIAAASHYYYGEPAEFEFLSLPVSGEITTDSASSDITDSAASATAMATGRKVDNGVLSQAIPGDGADLETTVQFAKSRGKLTGLVSTSFITHATPAAFGAHTESRANYESIAEDYLTESRPEVLFGGGGYGMETSAAEEVYDTVATDRSELSRIDPADVDRAALLVGDGHIPYVDERSADVPGLVEMSQTAIEILEENPDGFLLVIEAARIDHASHGNDIARVIPEVKELSDVVNMIVSDDELMETTTVLVISDHETGGLEVLAGNGKDALPDVSWSTMGHTGVPVPFYATGSQAAAFEGLTDNTGVSDISRNLLD